MNTDRHTPGPWRYCPTNAGHMIGGSVPGYLAEVRDCGSGDVKANARLIAAAPALLAALRDLIPLASEGVRFLDYGAVRPDEWESADKARAMLAAACATLTAVEGL